LLILVVFALFPFQEDLYQKAAMDVLQAGAGLENVDSGYEKKMTENTPMTDISEKIRGGKIFTLN